jgi:hypothetical protein
MPRGRAKCKYIFRLTGVRPSEKTLENDADEREKTLKNDAGGVK